MFMMDEVVEHMTEKVVIPSADFGQGRFHSPGRVRHRDALFRTGSPWRHLLAHKQDLVRIGVRK